MMISHELLMLAIQTKYPHLSHGQDYVVGHPLHETTGEHSGNAFIMSWASTNPPKPSDAEYESLMHSAVDLLPVLQERNVKAHRNQLLAECDWTKLADVNHAEEESAAWSAYRQALRDVPDQPGYPADINWPVKPA